MHASAEFNSPCANDEGAGTFTDIQREALDDKTLERAFHMSGVEAYLDYYQL